MWDGLLNNKQFFHQNKHQTVSVCVAGCPDENNNQVNMSECDNSAFPFHLQIYIYIYTLQLQLEAMCLLMVSVVSSTCEWGWSSAGENQQAHGVAVILFYVIYLSACFSYVFNVCWQFYSVLGIPSSIDHTPSKGYRVFVILIHYTMLLVGSRCVATENRTQYIKAGPIRSFVASVYQTLSRFPIVCRILFANRLNEARRDTLLTWVRAVEEVQNCPWFRWTYVHVFYRS